MCWWSAYLAVMALPCGLEPKRTPHIPFGWERAAPIPSGESMAELASPVRQRGVLSSHVPCGPHGASLRSSQLRNESFTSDFDGDPLGWRGSGCCNSSGVGLQRWTLPRDMCSRFFPCVSRPRTFRTESRSAGTPTHATQVAISLVWNSMIAHLP